MKKKIIEIFKNNLKYVDYARTGIVYYTDNIAEIYYLINKGWKYNRVDSVSPPAITICDITDCKKIMQYGNTKFNLAYFLFITNLKKNNLLGNFINVILNEKNIYYKDFYYHISDGPILENEVRIKGIDNRINTLKIDLVKYFIQSKEYLFYVNLVEKKISNKKVYIELPLKELKEDSKIIEYYNWLTQINKAIFYDINIKKNSFVIDKKELETVKYDIILFIPNGCYKYMDIFVNNKNIEKMFFWEIHADNKYRGNHIINNLEMKNKRVLIIDSAFSGKTLQMAKQYVEEKGGNPITLGIYPKSRNILNIMDYALIGNKVYNVQELKNDDENLFIELYIKNLEVKY